MHAYEIERYEADLREPHHEEQSTCTLQSSTYGNRVTKNNLIENTYTEAVLRETSYSNIFLSNNLTSDYPTDIHYEVRLQQQLYKSSATTTSLRRTTYGTSYNNNVLPTPSVYIFGREVLLE